MNKLSYYYVLLCHNIKSRSNKTTFYNCERCCSSSGSKMTMTSLFSVGCVKYGDLTQYRLTVMPRVRFRVQPNLRLQKIVILTSFFASERQRKNKAESLLVVSQEILFSGFLHLFVVKTEELVAILFLNKQTQIKNIRYTKPNKDSIYEQNLVM